MRFKNYTFVLAATARMLKRPSWTFDIEKTLGGRGLAAVNGPLGPWPPVSEIRTVPDRYPGTCHWARLTTRDPVPPETSFEEISAPQSASWHSQICGFLVDCPLADSSATTCHASGRARCLCSNTPVYPHASVRAVPYAWIERAGLGADAWSMAWIFKRTRDHTRLSAMFI